MSASLKVLYIDDNPKDTNLYGKIWKDLLTRHRFPNLDFRTSSNFDMEEVEKWVPHLIIADNVVVSSERKVEFDNEGAQFISILKEKISHITCILFTRATFSIKTLGQLTPNPDILIPKTHFRSPEYQNNWLGPQINRLLSRRPIGNITFENPSDVSEYQELIATIECILEQCLNDVSSYEVDLAAQIRLSKLTGGASGASVFLAEISGVERFHNVPLVFRISDTDHIKEEVEHYKRFVSLQVPHDLRVELIGFGDHLRYGGALYAFALADVKNTTTALKILKERDHEQSTALRQILEKIFTRDNLGWYNKDNNKTIDIAEHFCLQGEYSPQKDHRRIRGISANLKKFNFTEFSIDGDYLSTKRHRLPLPRSIVERLAGEKIQTAVVHGDLNLNNIIVSRTDGRIALIDFEYSGIDHKFKDLISLEVSILDLNQNFNNFDEAFETFKIRHEISKFWEYRGDTLSEIRKIAASKITKSDTKPEVLYLTCLAFHLFKVAALESVNHNHFLAMLASLCAALDHLDNILEE